MTKKANDTQVGTNVDSADKRNETKAPPKKDRATERKAIGKKAIVNTEEQEKTTNGTDLEQPSTVVDHDDEKMETRHTPDDVSAEDTNPDVERENEEPFVN